jgi:hypothetical protein
MWREIFFLHSEIWEWILESKQGLHFGVRLLGAEYGKYYVFLFFAACWGLFGSQKILQNFSDFSSHRIFKHIYEALNINKK